MALSIYDKHSGRSTMDLDRYGDHEDAGEVPHLSVSG